MKKKDGRKPHRKKTTKKIIVKKGVRKSPRKRKILGTNIVLSIDPETAHTTAGILLDSAHRIENKLYELKFSDYKTQKLWNKIKLQILDIIRHDYFELSHELVGIGPSYKLKKKRKKDACEIKN